MRRVAVLSTVVLAVAAVGFGFAYEGSGSHLASGVRVDGVDVGGLSNADATKLLQGRFAQVAAQPLLLRVAGHRFRVTAGSLGVQPNWQAALDDARSKSGGPIVVRGFRRLYVRFFGIDVTPHALASTPALDRLLDRIEGVVDVPRRDARLVLNGLHPAVIGGRTGTVLDRRAAGAMIVAALGSFDRTPLALPLKKDQPKVTETDLGSLLKNARLALSSPVRLSLGPTYYRVPRWRIAKMLSLPTAGSKTLKLAGSEADKFFARLEKVVDRPARDATFAVDGPNVRVVASLDARVLDVEQTAKNLLSAALSRTHRVARIVVASKHAKVTTQDAQKMGITGEVSTYTTIYGGIANRIHNVQLVAHLIDDHLIAPGEEFSFNKTTGERTAAKGFLEAPVIINGELETGLGGGVCQVSTTVFNAAYDAGLKITARTNHALYISHYPQGRDATVDYPDVDLKFVNDTGHWLLLRTFVGESSLTVNLYGTPQHRKVESETSPLVVTGGPPVKRTPDPTLFKGQQVIDDPGSSSLSTSVHRKVYSADGKLLYDNVWYSNYRGNTKLIRFGTKPKPKPKPKIAPVVLPPVSAILPPQ